MKTDRANFIAGQFFMGSGIILCNRGAPRWVRRVFSERISLRCYQLGLLAGVFEKFWFRQPMLGIRHSRGRNRWRMTRGQRVRLCIPQWLKGNLKLCDFTLFVCVYVLYSWHARAARARHGKEAEPKYQTQRNIECIRHMFKVTINENVALGSGFYVHGIHWWRLTLICPVS